jgi:vacuolar-type H+-ATPase subunit F/Vma7
VNTLRVAVLCRPEIAPGFALAGLRPVEVADCSEASRRLETLLDSDLGLVLVEAPLHDGLDPELQKRLMSRPVPLVVPFPGPVWAESPSAADAYVVELLRRAIGYQVRLR